MYPGKQSNDETVSVPLPLLVAQKWKCHAGPRKTVSQAASAAGPQAVWTDADKIIYVFLVSE